MIIRGVVEIIRWLEMINRGVDEIIRRVDQVNREVEMINRGAKRSIEGSEHQSRVETINRGLEGSIDPHNGAAMNYQNVQTPSEASPTPSSSAANTPKPLHPRQLVGYSHAPVREGMPTRHPDVRAKESGGSRRPRLCRPLAQLARAPP